MPPRGGSSDLLAAIEYAFLIFGRGERTLQARSGGSPFCEPRGRSSSPGRPNFMRLLYLDHSGDMKDLSQRHFVLAGFSVFERQTFWVSKKLDEIAARFDPASPNELELHASPMRSGRGLWRRFAVSDRIQATQDALSLAVDRRNRLTFFAAAVEKTSTYREDPVNFAFEQVCSRFDMSLTRLHKANDTQRGIIIFDKTGYEQMIQNLTTDFRTIGHTWGVVRNLSEVPLFLDSRASCMLQLADLIAFAVYRAVEHDDHQLFSIIKDNFDPVGNMSYRLIFRNTAGIHRQIIKSAPLFDHLAPS